MGQRHEYQLDFKSVVPLAAVILILTGGGLLWDVLADTHAPLAWAVGASAVVTFFGMLLIIGVSDKSQMRTAMTATFVIVYFILLGLFAFLGGGDEATPEIAKNLVTNFTFLMGVVIAFYFGTTTYEKVAAANRPDAAPETTTPTTPPVTDPDATS